MIFIKKIIILLIIVAFFTGCNKNCTKDDLILDKGRLTANEMTSQQKDVYYSIDENDILAVINKWKFELSAGDRYDLFVPVKMACLLDPFVFETYSRLELEKLSIEEAVAKINSFSSTNVSHLQAYSGFANYSSKMPWGRYGLKKIYKRLLPSEMKAMSIYTGKISGACESLSYFYSALMRIKGLDSHNIITLRDKSHTLAIAKWEEEYYMINNTQIFPININNKVMMDSASKNKYIAFFGDSFYSNKNVRTYKEIFLDSTKLLDSLENSNNLSSVKIENLEDVPLDSHYELKEYLFDELEKKDFKLSQLIKYAYQSLDVQEPHLYLKASLKGPLAKKLSTSLKSKDEIIEWINNNIQEGSIFKDGDKRIMTADQVIVYKRGNSLDKAVLIYTLMKHNNIDVRIEMEDDEPSIVESAK